MVNTLEKILSDLGTAMSEFIPRILGALVVMLVALIVAILLQRLATRLSRPSTWMSSRRGPVPQTP